MPTLPIEMTLGEKREWEIPFSPEEYRGRFKRVRAEMERCGVDTLYVTSPANLTYLTGYDCRWYRRSTPTGLAINLKDDLAIFFDDISHRGLVLAGTGLIDHAAFFSRFRDTQREGWIYRNTVEDVIDTIAARGWLKGTAAVEHWALAPGGVSLRHIEARMNEKGAHIAPDGSWIVDRVKLKKSPSELQLVEEACAIADAGISAVAREFKSGMTEIQIQGIAHYAMSKLNGEEPAIRTSTASGPKTRAHHNLPTRRKIVHGDIIVMDLCGSVHRYHGNLARTFSVGVPDRRWTDLVDKSAVSIQKVVEAVRPGDSAERVVEVAREYLTSVDLAKYGWFIGGYDLGIAVPPDWTGHTYLSGLSFERADMNVGMVVNFENVLDVTEGWPGGYGVMNIDTLVMTETGLRILSKLERKIFVVGD
jgi:Xaa-Pro aminopeptidase